MLLQDHKRGFTLIELLIVLSIISILTVAGVINFRDFAQDQVIIKSTGQIQSFLRLAQRNAQSSVKCTSEEPASQWLVVFESNKNTLTLICKSPFSETKIKDLTLDKGIEINQITANPSCPGADFPNYTATLIYNAPVGEIDFVIARGAPGNLECSPKTSEIKLTVMDNQTQTTKEIIISKGGEVNVK